MSSLSGIEDRRTQMMCPLVSGPGPASRRACTIRAVTARPPRPQRADTREVAELKVLKTTQPELAAAVDMQLALVDMQRRVQSRVPLPWIDVEPEWLKAQQTAGKPLIRFRDIPLDWTDFRSEEH